MPKNTHAVRWAKRIVRADVQFSRWHITNDAHQTLCHLSIPLISETEPSMPETSDNLAVADCKQCKRISEAIQ